MFTSKPKQIDDKDNFLDHHEKQDEHKHIPFHGRGSANNQI